MSRYISFRVMQRLLCIPVLAAASCFFLLEFQEAARFISYPVYFLSILAFLSSYCSIGCFGFFVAFMAGLMPFFSPIAVTLSMQLLLLSRLIKRPISPLQLRSFDSLGLLLFIGIFILGYIRSVAAQVDVDLFLSFYNAKDVFGFVTFLEANNRALYQSGIHLLGMILMVLLAGEIAAVKHEQTFRNGVVVGIIAIAFVASIVLVLQVTNSIEILSYNRAAFWVLTQRYAATFADPNSFGIAAGLYLILTWVLFQGNRNNFLLIIAALALGIAALWSGSRTLVLLLVLCTIIIGACYLRARKRLLPAAVLLGLGVAILIYPTTNATLQNRVDVPTVTRILQTANANTFLQMLESRIVFARIALQVWETEPLFGVGLGRFYSLQEQAADALEIELHSWRDNANNFYLQILAEHGIIGVALLSFAALLLLLKQFNGAESIARRARIGVLLFGLLLCTGPHLLFAEVKFLFALLLGLTLQTTRSQSRSAQYFAIVLLIAMTMWSVKSLSPQVGDRGVYATERSGSGHYFWTSGSGEINISSILGADSIVRFRAVRPNTSFYPVLITLAAIDSENQTLSVTSIVAADDGWQSHRIASDKTAKIKFHVDKTWKPAGDNRYLGIIFENTAPRKEGSE